MKKLTRVRPEDFDVELLMAAAREGRLYVDEGKKIVNKEKVKNEVRAYVARISTFVTRRYSSSIDELWEEILNDDDFVELLMPGNKTKKCREFNKYNVMRIIGVLREKDVYEHYSDRKYAVLLEQTNKDSSYRSYLGMGLEQHSLLVKIRQIVTLTFG
jgi:transcription elongation factor GreA-like protein